MSIDYVLKFGFVMVMMILVDTCWAKYTLAMQKKAPLASGLWSVGIMLCGALVTLNYVGDRTMIIAAAIGAFIGTFITVKHDRDKDKPRKKHRNPPLPP
jgi:hypothetical protein